MRVFIDSNIPMYVAGGDHPNRKIALEFLKRIEERELEGCTSTEVLQEILYRYSSLAKLNLAQRVYDAFVELCPEVLPITLAETDVARDLVCDGNNSPHRQQTGAISCRDALHAATMRNHGIEWIATFDKGFDNFPGIRRYRLI
ncbi:MAG: type II toxin-antitoxin system VapC family toxin [Acidobacteriota bacterium]